MLSYIYLQFNEVKNCLQTNDATTKHLNKSGAVIAQHKTFSTFIESEEESEPEKSEETKNNENMAERANDSEKTADTTSVDQEKVEVSTNDEKDEISNTKTTLNVKQINDNESSQVEDPS